MAPSGVAMSETPESGCRAGERHSQIGGHERSAGGEDRPDPIFHPNNGDVSHKQYSREFRSAFDHASRVGHSTGGGLPADRLDALRSESSSANRWIRCPSTQDLKLCRDRVVADSLDKDTPSEYLP